MSEPTPLRIRYDLAKCGRVASDSEIMADFRDLPDGTDLAEFADMLAADLAKHGTVTRAACAAMARASANLQAMTLLGYEAPEILAVLGLAAARLEMQVSADGT